MKFLWDIPIKFDGLKEYGGCLHELLEGGLGAEVKDEPGVGGDSGLHLQHSVNLQVRLPSRDGAQINKNLYFKVIIINDWTVDNTTYILILIL